MDSAAVPLHHSAHQAPRSQMPQKGKKYPRTHCIQLHVNKISEASRHFQNFSITEKPIVIVPDTLQCFACFPSFFTCCLTIPDGMWVLYQRCGRDMGEQRPGFICCWPFWYRVSHVVTKQVRRTPSCAVSTLSSPLSPLAPSYCGSHLLPSPTTGGVLRRSRAELPDERQCDGRSGRLCDVSDRPDD